MGGADAGKGGYRATWVLAGVFRQGGMAGTTWRVKGVGAWTDDSPNLLPLVQWAGGSRFSEWYSSCGSWTGDCLDWCGGWAGRWVECRYGHDGDGSSA